MDFWQGIIIAAIAASSGAITAFVNSRIEARKKKKEKEDSTKQILDKLNEMETKLNNLESRLGGLERAQRITMHERIKRLAAKYCENGEISFSDYEIIKQMHSIYHNDLHGNGFLDSVMEDVDRLPKVR